MTNYGIFFLYGPRDFASPQQFQNQYDIYVEAFDSDNHRLFPSDNWVVEIESDVSFLKVLKRSSQQFLLYHHPKFKGAVKIFENFNEK